jgi:hypothetical protein
MDRGWEVYGREEGLCYGGIMDDGRENGFLWLQEVCGSHLPVTMNMHRGGSQAFLLVLFSR